MPPKYAQSKYWILTIPHAHYTPYLPPNCTYTRGQLELGEGGFLHWQLVCYFKSKVRLRAVIECFGRFHAEPTKSDAAREYVWKSDTRVDGTQFELGTLPMRRNSSIDWVSIVHNCKAGRMDDIPPDIFVRCYNQLSRMRADYAEPLPMEREVFVYWGVTGSGKSRRAWSEAGLQAYPKDPNSKFWCGYRDHTRVVIDEFRGGIGISHVLRWFDRYPVLVELKGSSAVLVAKQIWITSNIHPREWYPDLDEATKAALIRRLNVVEFPEIGTGL